MEIWWFILNVCAFLSAYFPGTLYIFSLQVYYCLQFSHNTCSNKILLNILCQHCQQLIFVCKYYNTHLFVALSSLQFSLFKKRILIFFIVQFLYLYCNFQLALSRSSFVILLRLLVQCQHMASIYKPYVFYCFNQCACLVGLKPLNIFPNCLNSFHCSLLNHNLSIASNECVLPFTNFQLLLHTCFQLQILYLLLYIALRLQ